MRENCFDMTYKNAILGGLAILAGGVLSSCNDSKSYAELLTDEMHSVNKFLANQDVVLELPDDGNFIEGADAPYYRLDEDGNVYMQVIDSGDRDLMILQKDGAIPMTSLLEPLLFASGTTR